MDVIEGGGRILKKRACTKKDSIVALKIVLRINSSHHHKNKRKHKTKHKTKYKTKQCTARKRCSKKRRRKKVCYPVFPRPQKCYHRHRPILCSCRAPHCVYPVCPIVPPIPCDPVDPPNPSRYIVEKECCGNILIQGNQPAIQIWSAEVDTNTTVVQIGIYCNTTSTDILEVEIRGKENEHISIPPGNTSNFVGVGITSVNVSSQDHHLTFVEGKFNISTTVHLHANPTIKHEEL